MLMTSLQFSSQIIMAKIVLGCGLVQRRAPEEQSWSNYLSQGDLRLASALLPPPVLSTARRLISRIYRV
jgi:hypothetical protein